MAEVVDGEMQTYVTRGGAYVRQHFFGKYPELLDLVSHLSDQEVFKLRRGGHDPVKVYNAYKAAVDTTGKPAVILAQTVKGYGLGEAGEGRNITHQQKKLNERELESFRSRFQCLPLLLFALIEEELHWGRWFPLLCLISCRCIHPDHPPALGTMLRQCR